MRNRLSCIVLSAVFGGFGTAGSAFELATGLDILNQPESKIEALHRFYVGKELGAGWHLGQSIYSSAAGDAGGAFFWGFEAMKDVSLGRNVTLRFSGFIGGGGGAAEVEGDGLMWRTNVAFAFPVTAKNELELGLSWVSIDGVDVDDPALSVGLHRALAAEGQAPVLRSVALRATGGAASDSSRNRSGGAQADLGLVGAELAFAHSPQMDVIFAADGAADGAEGYMQILSGARYYWGLGAVNLYGEAALGLGGGGDVDTGSGWFGQAGVGLAVPLSSGLDVQFSLGQQIADGAFDGTYGQIRLARVFARDTRAPQAQRWQFSAGLSLQVENDGLRKASSFGSGNIVMQESSLDMFLTDQLYLTGNAQTTMSGDVSGYAIGMLGVGYELPLTSDWTVSLEGHVGAAGGGAVETNGGPIGSLRAEIDYRVTDRAKLSLGIGKLQALKGDGGMAPTFAQLGLKIPFMTH
ncbi:hypothetical protein BFP70_02810 [Thioclava sp. SK-1]|uniref:hypothetical protein n=1 Tax=Thioclava sp. SK-1 TaxID=1889770 RepID=UPI000825DC44|nr:hypothetical protein [Thioclava sp. SK-1]OCX67110.1 hypothetical protein BFP70_02810 [Thioclava sp. SK-1]